ncbi:MAG: polysulfide reductase NrfD [Ardenticatenaceae bacterium]|nr:polysulfide reductase NrfD [Ardenticatenaceae bacterium]MCB8991793.1 polysulfide reductase NrfD [Ardenticatenaceae bacterium]
MTIDVPISTATQQKNYGFVIDNRKCIGCHACSTACKSENEVPLGVYRTWVKYVETGQYPDSRRHFQVTRCNHCANPPCARICPVTAMYQRDDGIVEFDKDVCIGCKACMQACPYDAIHIDPDTNTAAKCHYCAHRTDIGLEPACVVVCPEHAIVSGDMNDPHSEISQVLAAQKVTVRKPEQGTSPKVFYINGNDVSLHPTATERTPETYMWADVVPLHEVNVNGNGHSANSQSSAENRQAKTSFSGTPLRQPQPQGQPFNGPIQFGSTVAEHMVQVGYNAQHKIPWHWPVPAYLTTKGLAAGLFMMLTLGWNFGWFAVDPLTAVIAGLTTLIFMGLTTAFLVIDLEKPERFLYILIRPQWRSWLARGAIFLVGFSTLATLWWLFEVGGWLFNYDVPWIRAVYTWAGLPLAIGVAVYTAFLFAQAEGRDLWQSPLLPFHLIVQAFMMGSSALLLLGWLIPTAPDAMTGTAKLALAIALIVDLFVTLLGEFGIPHPSEVAAKAAHEISNGRYRNHFWMGSMTIGHIFPLALLLVSSRVSFSGLLLAVAALCVAAGLYLYEYAFVMAPQEVPNS